MKRYGIERQTLLVTLIPILVMAILLESYFIFTHFADLDRALLERSQLLSHQLASSSEYAVFSGNTILLQQNVDAARSYRDVKSIAIFDAQSKLILSSDKDGVQAHANDATSLMPIYQDNDVLRLHEPIMATQINLDGLVSAPSVANQLGAVLIEISKERLNKQKTEYLLFSLLFTLMVLAVAMILALRTARSITLPIVQMHQTIRRIAAGDLATDTVPQCSIHELHELATGISDMSQQLLRDRDMLESRIVEATDGLRVKKEEVEQAQLEKERLNENLAVALSELQAIMEANPDILYVFNTRSELVQWNSSFARFCGLTPGQMLNRHVNEFVCQADRALATKGVAEVFAKGSATVEMHFVRHDGVNVPYLCNGVVLKNIAGEVIGFTGTGRDVSERKMATEHIHHMAHYDILTDLPNRSLLSERLQHALITSKRERTHLALMFLDLDMFKYINDKLGHDIGDLLLKEVAKRIQDCLRESDTAARIGGDEFVVLLPSVESTTVAMLVAEKIRHELCLPFEISGHIINLSSSIGVAVYPEHGSEEKLLLKNADTAMYLAKRNGRNTVVLFSP
ncbi:MAG TPA: diguanylate cyclase [Gallionellaceae bacterium]|nr:diguanylate cyclase [Gallionellaceae bacterium]